MIAPLKSTGCGLSHGLQASWWCLRPIQGGTALCEETRRICATIQALEKLHEDGFCMVTYGAYRPARTKEKAGSLTLIWRQGSTTNNCSPEATNFSDDGMRCENIRSVSRARLVRIGTIDFYCHSFDPPPTGADNRKLGLMFLKWKKIDETKQATPEMMS
jgi:hypothetical protein